MKGLDQVIMKIVGPRHDPLGKTAAEISREMGISQSTLSRWIGQAGTIRSMNMKKKQPSQQHNNTPRQKRPQDWRPEEKMRVVMEAAALSESELGAFLRREGLHESQLKEWRETMLKSLKTTKSRSKVSAEAKELKELKKELARKDKALAETAALLVLQKKAQALWGDGDSDT